MQNTEKPDKERTRKVRIAIKWWLKKNGISYKQAAEKLGMSYGSLRVRLYEGFSPASTKKWINAFGFNERFLLTGEGSLVDDDDENDIVPDDMNDGPTLDDMLLTLAKTQSAALTAALAELERYRALYGPLPETDEDCCIK